MNFIHYGDNSNFTKQYKSGPRMGWFLLWGSIGFSHLYKKSQEAKNKRFYLLELQNKVFANTFCDNSTQVSVVTYNCHTHRPLSDSLHKQCMPTLDIFGIKPFIIVIFKEQSCIEHSFRISFIITSYLPPPPRPINHHLLTPKE
jgi:hypothetical protein